MTYTSKATSLYAILLTYSLRACNKETHSISDNNATITANVENSCLSKNFYFTNKAKNIKEILEVRNTFFDSINKITIERHYWYASDCDKNTFYILTQNNKHIFLPYCDETYLKQKSYNYFKSNLELYYYFTLNNFNIKNPRQYASFYEKSILGNPSNSITKNSLQIRYYPTKYGQSSPCMWQVKQDNAGHLSFDIINKFMYSCISI